MAEGAVENGDDMVVGRINQSDERTRLEATKGEPDGYEDDFVLEVGISGDKVLVKNPNGVDAIHAKGTVEFPTGGMIGVIPAGNGVVGQGLNGLVGYVHPKARDTGEERAVGAGVLGLGGPGSIGVFGRGVNGVVGYEENTSRDLTFEAEKAGVLGVGENGVSGLGKNGAGVHGKGLPGVLGEGPDGVTVVPGGPGVSGIGETGVYAQGQGSGTGVIATGTTGVDATGTGGQGGVFRTKRAPTIGGVLGTVRAQILLDPLENLTPDQLPGAAGELLVLIIPPPADQPDHKVAQLWFCRISGAPGAATWVQLA
jgi:hypothetical protein